MMTPKVKESFALQHIPSRKFSPCRPTPTENKNKTKNIEKQQKNKYTRKHTPITMTAATYNVDVYQYRYHFRYSSTAEQNAMKRVTHRSKLLQIIEPKMFPFSTVQHSMSGLVQYLHLKQLPPCCLKLDQTSVSDADDERNEKDNVDGDEDEYACNRDLFLPSCISGDDGDNASSSHDLKLQEFVFCHIYPAQNREEPDDHVASLDQILPESIISKKPELNVTCTVHELHQFRNVSWDSVRLLCSVDRYLMNLLSKQMNGSGSSEALNAMEVTEEDDDNQHFPENSIVLIPLIVRSDQRSNSGSLNSNCITESSIEKVLYLKVLQHFFTKRDIRRDVDGAQLTIFEWLHQFGTKHIGTTMSITEISSIFAKYVPLLTNIDDLNRMRSSESDFEQALQQADVYSQLMRDRSLVRMADNFPFIAEALDFFTLDLNDETGLYSLRSLPSPVLRANPIENPAPYKLKKWFIENKGTVTSRLYTLLAHVGAQTKQQQPEEHEEQEKVEEARVNSTKILAKLQESNVVHQSNKLLECCCLTPFQYAFFHRYLKNVAPIVRNTTEQQVKHYGQLYEFEKRFGTSFFRLAAQDRSHRSYPLYLRNAFTHMSYAQEKQLRWHSYERLEFLGDSTLHICVATYIFQQFHSRNTNAQVLDTDWYDMLMYVIGNKQLCKKTMEMNLDELILAPRGPSGKLPVKMTADVFESIIGATQLTHGFNFVRQLVERQYIVDCVRHSKLFQCSPLMIDQSDVDLKRHLLESYSDRLMELERIMHYSFNDRGWLLEALIAPSYNNSVIVYTSADEAQMRKLLKMRKSSMIKCEPSSDGQTLVVGNINRLNNESLKFLGVALLKFLSVQYVYGNFPKCDPRQMTLSVHSILDLSDVCFQSALREMQLEKFVLMRQSEYETVALFDSLVAIFAAVYVDSGYRLVNDSDSTVMTPVQALFHRLMIGVFEREEQLHPDHVKSPLKHYMQHLCQLVYKVVPHFDVMELEQQEAAATTTTTSEPVLHCTVTCHDEVIAQCTGPNKKEVEKLACEQAIKLLLSRIDQMEEQC